MDSATAKQRELSVQRMLEEEEEEEGYEGEDYEETLKRNAEELFEQIKTRQLSDLNQLEKKRDELENELQERIGEIEKKNLFHKLMSNQQQQQEEQQEEEEKEITIDMLPNEPLNHKSFKFNAESIQDQISNEQAQYNHLFMEQLPTHQDKHIMNDHIDPTAHPTGIHHSTTQDLLGYYQEKLEQAHSQSPVMQECARQLKILMDK
ncbi:hypothetical protein AKO1_015187, partial [Acrasis kona]